MAVLSPLAVCLKGIKVHRKCFLASTQAKTFHEASEDCISRGGTLGTPQTGSENDALYEYLRQSVGAEAEIWLGLNDMAAEGVWVDMTGQELGDRDHGAARRRQGRELRRPGRRGQRQVVRQALPRQAALYLPVRHRVAAGRRGGCGGGGRSCK